MKTGWVLAAALLVGGGSIALLMGGVERRDAAAEAEAYRIEQLHDAIGSISYVKDGRTDLCFAYTWGGMANGGPSLASVPCSAIPADLLTVVKAGL